MVTIGTPDGQRFVGKVVDDTLRKNIQGSKHILRIDDSIGWDKQIIDNISPEIENLEVLDTEDNTVYRVGRYFFQRHSVVRDFGHNPQYFLSRKQWSQRIDGQESLFSKEEK